MLWLLLGVFWRRGLMPGDFRLMSGHFRDYAQIYIVWLVGYLVWIRNILYLQTWAVVGHLSVRDASFPSIQCLRSLYAICPGTDPNSQGNAN